MDKLGKSQSVLFSICLLSFSLIAEGRSAVAPPSLPTDPSQQAQPEEPAWYQKHATGWFWRDVDPETTEKQGTAEETIPHQPPESLYPSLNETIADPLARLEQLQKAVEIAKAKMVLQPTPENIMYWTRVQDQVLRRSSLLSDNWQRLMWQNPEYDYSQKRPVSPAALETYSAQYQKDVQQALREIARDYGLYFIISGRCPYCHAMAPYLKRFADSYGFSVVTVTIDGGSVPEYPDAKYSPEFARKLGVKTTPAIIIARPRDDIIVPVAYGFIDLQELERRIYRLFRQKPGQPLYEVPVNTSSLTEAQ